MDKQVIVTKFGGSSLSDSQQFIKVKNIILKDERRSIVIPSAPGKSKEEKHKVTDLLLMCYQLASHRLHFDEIYDLIRSRFITIRDELELTYPIEEDLDFIYQEIYKGADADYCASRGEYLNGKLLANYLDYTFIDATELIRVKQNKADMGETYQLIQEKINKKQAYVIPGFYGLNRQGQIETFTRGGSDVTGALIAAGLKAYLYENWTDVSGFLVVNPKIVPHSLPIKFITYGELRELSYMGAPVLHEEAVFPMKKDNIPIRIQNTNQPEDFGTYIIADDIDYTEFITEPVHPSTITGIAGKEDYTVIRVEKTHMSQDLSFYRKLLSVFESNDIPIEHMPTSIDTISIVVHSHYLENKDNKIKEEINIYCEPDNIIISRNLSIIAIVGRRMIDTKGTSSKIFTALADSGVNIRMISQGSSQMNIIVGVADQDFNLAISAIYNAFYKEEE